MINGHCWVCGFCGAEACGLGSVITINKISCNGENLPGEIKSGVIAEVKKVDEPFPGD